eukprot:626531-Pyramimonas_sp.AAC.1
MNYRFRGPLAQSATRVLELAPALDSSLLGPAGPTHISSDRALVKRRKLGTAEVADHRVVTQSGAEPELLGRNAAQLSDHALAQQILDQLGGRGSEGVGRPR